MRALFSRIAMIAACAVMPLAIGASRAQDGSGSFEVSGVTVDVSGSSADAARTGGWRLAQRKGWSMLSQRLTGKAGSLPDSTLDSLVTGIVVENEEIGPGRYIARLGVLFNRNRAAEILGVSGFLTRSPPLLVLPLMRSGGVVTTFERDNEWVDAWARFRTGNTTIDYIRPAGNGPDALLMNAGLTGRPGRGWWRNVLDQYGASDVLIPQVALYRQWPGGPVIGVFRAGHGPDNRELARFSLRVANADGVDALLDTGVRRLDEAYQSALRGGILRPDPLLEFVPPSVEPTPTPGLPDDIPVIEGGDTMLPSAPVASVTLQFETPGVAAVNAAEASVRAIPNVRSAVTSSLALGGTSLMRVEFAGDPAVLAVALESRGWRVEGSGNVYRIGRAIPAGPAPAEAPPPQ
ncbi:heavy-metal-associated domain-containing protein [Sphingomonas sp.]|uniref:heavy-metal-associated domain-containing protein n=1 Tax=Sphingomonas sp. TaxID=28214 RepID=UPI002CF245D0|nr:heavy-metal-associated domain-containing protein [Sphingomonas sp.]HTG39962.1 heavy-metal-associated domain-containing protein [Sphingomonas sp.]